MGKFTKDLPTVPALTDASIFAVTDETIKTYKTTLGDIATHIEKHDIEPPVVLKDKDPLGIAAGTIRWDIDGVATLSQGIDHTNLEVDDAINAGNFSTIVVSKGAYPSTIYVRPTAELTTDTVFYYGPPTLVTQDSTGGSVNNLSVSGVSSDGPMVVSGPVTLHNMVKKRTQPAFCAVSSIDQVIAGGAWTTVHFFKVDATDYSHVSFTRMPPGKDAFNIGYSTFTTPWGDGYDYEVYSFHVHVNLKVTINVPVYVNIRLFGTDTLGSASGTTLAGSTTPFYVNSTGGYQPINVVAQFSTTVMLKPRYEPIHRYISVQLIHGNAVPWTVDLDTTNFSGICHG